MATATALRAVSLDALDSDNPIREGIRVYFDRRQRTRVISLHRKHLPLNPHNPPPLDQKKRVYEAQHEVITGVRGGNRAVLSRTEADCQALLLRLVLPKQHYFKTSNYRHVLLRNNRNNSVGLLLIAHAGLLIEVTLKRSRVPLFIYVTHELELIFDTHEVVEHHRSSR